MKHSTLRPSFAAPLTTFVSPFMFVNTPPAKKRGMHKPMQAALPQATVQLRQTGRPPHSRQRTRKQPPMSWASASVWSSPRWLP